MQNALLDVVVDYTFDERELYPSVEEKAAMLLYLVTKNYSFSDGYKSIAATLVALTLLIAESRPEEKDTMVKVVVNLIGHTDE